jgi:hypothetical protein
MAANSNIDILINTIVNGQNQLDTLNSSIDTLSGYLKAAALSFVSLVAAQGIKEMADYAARTETLGVTLKVVSQNAGYTAESISAYEKELKGLGITTQAARESMTQMIQAGIPLSAQAEGSASTISKLARAAQDLAVVTGENSSQTLQRLTVNISQLDTMGLRFMGLTIDVMGAEEKFATQIGTTSKALTQKQKIMAVTNAVLEESLKLSGAYEESMETVGKKVASLTRYQEELANTIGKNLLPAYGAMVDNATSLLSILDKMAQGQGANSETAIQLGKDMGNLSAEISSVVLSIASFVKENMGMLSSVTSNLIGLVTDVVSAFGKVFNALEQMGVLKVMLTGLTVLVAGFRDGLTLLGAIIEGYFAAPLEVALGMAIKGWGLLLSAVGATELGAQLQNAGEGFVQVGLKSKAASDAVFKNFSEGRTHVMDFANGVDTANVSLSQFGKSLTLKEINTELVSLADGTAKASLSMSDFSEAQKLTTKNVVDFVKSGKASEEQINAMIGLAKEAGLVLPEGFSSASAAAKTSRDEVKLLNEALSKLGTSTTFSGIADEIQSMIRAQQQGTTTAAEQAAQVGILEKSIKKFGESGGSFLEVSKLETKLATITKELQAQFDIDLKNMGLTASQLKDHLDDKFSGMVKSLQNLVEGGRASADEFNAAFVLKIDTAKTVAGLTQFQNAVDAAKKKAEDFELAGNTTQQQAWFKASASAADYLKTRFDLMLDNDLKSAKTAADFERIENAIKTYAKNAGESAEFIASKLVLVEAAHNKLEAEIAQSSISNELKKVGLTFEQVSGQASKATADIIANLKALAKDAEVTGTILYQAFSKAIDTSKSIADLQEFIDTLKTFKSEGKLTFSEYQAGIEKATIKFDALFEAQLKAASTKEDFDLLTLAVKKLGSEGGISAENLAIKIGLIASEAKLAKIELSNIDIAPLLNKIGITAEEMGGKASKAVVGISDALKLLAKDSKVTADEYYQAFNKATGSAKTLADIGELNASLKETFATGKIGWSEFSSGVQLTSIKFRELLDAQIASAKTKEDFDALTTSVKTLGSSGAISATDLANAMAKIDKATNDSIGSTKRLAEEQKALSAATLKEEQARTSVAQQEVSVQNALKALTAAKLVDSKEHTASSRLQVQIAEQAVEIERRELALKKEMVLLAQAERAAVQASNNLKEAQAEYDKDKTAENAAALESAKGQVTAAEALVSSTAAEVDNLAAAVEQAKQLKAELEAAAASEGGGGGSSGESDHMARWRAETDRANAEMKAQHDAMIAEDARYLQELTAAVGENFSQINKDAEGAALGIRGIGTSADSLAKAIQSVMIQAAQTVKSATDAAASFSSTARGIHEELLSAMGQEGAALASRFEQRKAELIIQKEQLDLQIELARVQAKAAGLADDALAGLNAAADKANASFTQALQDLDQLERIQQQKLTNSANMAAQSNIGTAANNVTNASNEVNTALDKTTTSVSSLGFSLGGASQSVGGVDNSANHATNSFNNLSASVTKGTSAVSGLSSSIDNGASSVGELSSSSDRGSSSLGELSSSADRGSSALSSVASSASSASSSLGRIKNVPAHAKGGDSVAGLALVGEEGPELVNFQGPGYVYTAHETKKILDGGNGGQKIPGFASGGSIDGGEELDLSSADIMSKIRSLSSSPIDPSIMALAVKYIKDNNLTAADLQNNYSSILALFDKGTKTTTKDDTPTSQGEDRSTSEKATSENSSNAEKTTGEKSASENTSTAEKASTEKASTEKPDSENKSFAEKLAEEKRTKEGAKNLPSHAKGGDSIAGLALVGEEGPELVNFQGPGYVYTANETKKILDGGNGGQKIPGFASGGSVAGGAALYYELQDQEVQSNQAQTKQSAVNNYELQSQAADAYHATDMQRTKDWYDRRTKLTEEDQASSIKKLQDYQASQSLITAQHQESSLAELESQFATSNLLRQQQNDNILQREQDGADRQAAAMAASFSDQADRLQAHNERMREASDLAFSKEIENLKNHFAFIDQLKSQDDASRIKKLADKTSEQGLDREQNNASELIKLQDEIALAKLSREGTLSEKEMLQLDQKDAEKLRKLTDKLAVEKLAYDKHDADKAKKLADEIELENAATARREAALIKAKEDAHAKEQADLAKKAEAEQKALQASQALQAEKVAQANAAHLKQLQDNFALQDLRIAEQQAKEKKELEDKFANQNLAIQQQNEAEVKRKETEFALANLMTSQHENQRLKDLEDSYAKEKLLTDQAREASLTALSDNLKREYTIWQSTHTPGAVPAFASGGSYSGGTALVGENGPEIINFNKPGQVYNASQTEDAIKSAQTALGLVQSAAAIASNLSKTSNQAASSAIASSKDDANPSQTVEIKLGDTSSKVKTNNPSQLLDNLSQLRKNSSR